VAILSSSQREQQLPKVNFRLSVDHTILSFEKKKKPHSPPMWGHFFADEGIEGADSLEDIDVKRLVICFDGTWNSADSNQADTNVALLARAIHSTVGTAGIPQLVLYLRGVGTEGLHAEVIVEGATGLGVDENIRTGYMFIAQNYLPGDEIFLFGFSRGAFSARSLSGLISACGILKRQRLGDLVKAWAYYRSGGIHSPADFISRYNSDSHLNPEIKFLGVWDTVGALGIPSGLFSEFDHKRYGFHDTGPSKVVKHGCHALAVDEHRDEFVPTLWTGTPPEGVTIDQVWFAGAHSDVGGGYITRKLADIPLVWMAKKVEADGLVLDWSCLPDSSKLDPNAPTHDSRTLVFAKDRLRPTYREVCGQPCHVSFYERLYAPMDNSGRPLPTINEAVHRSVIERYGDHALICSADQSGSCITRPYQPKNIAPLLDVSSKIKAGVRVEEY
jgi:Uncharacterized alpha/beta hydrolase domain (DUF2235)